MIRFTGSLIQRVTTLYNPLLHIHTRTSAHSHVFTNHCSAAVSNGGRSPSSGFPNCTPVSTTSFSQQQLTTTETQQFPNSLTQSLINQFNSTNSHRPAYNILARTAEKTPFHYCSAIVAVETCLRSRYLATAVVYLLISRSLLSKGSTWHNINKNK
jgi:hypothetical protein